MTLKYTLTSRATDHLANQIRKQVNTINRNEFRGFKPWTLRLIKTDFDESEAVLKLTFQDEPGPVVRGTHLFAETDFGLFPEGDLKPVTSGE